MPSPFYGVAYLRNDFASFVGWASCPSLVFQGGRPPYKNHPLIQQRLFYLLFRFITPEPSLAEFFPKVGTVSRHQTLSK